MGINYRRTQPLFGTVGTTRILTVATNPATLITLTSSYQAMTLANMGSGILLWGDSGIAVNSGNQLFVTALKSWDNLQDGFQVYVRAESVSTVITVTEFQV